MGAQVPCHKVKTNSMSTPCKKLATVVHKKYKLTLNKMNQLKLQNEQKREVKVWKTRKHEIRFPSLAVTILNSRGSSTFLKARKPELAAGK